MTLASQIHEDHLRRNLELVRRGVKNWAAGIRRCRDCREPFITHGSPHPWCEDCRGNHTQHCRICITPYPIDEDSERLCPTCRVHPTLLLEDPK